MDKSAEPSCSMCQMPSQGAVTGTEVLGRRATAAFAHWDQQAGVAGLGLQRLNAQM